ncbi:hypothetical protein DFQ27_006012 [Actinomortierella ambigua]|uniref:FAD-binding domain-containing protein n=1 Tax=Actinomortierella ambigua TaxID=1343610 RepID=A0A9P6U1Q5_9FUNG|nr:hypothetical protein DFQ27_006012 [Actinomortierella ambigua]
MHVLISGAGIGGVMLAGLLEKAGISYQVFEKASEVKPLGSAISFSSNIIPVFRQLGIFDEIERHSLPLFKFTRNFVPAREAWNDDFSFMKERYGDYIRIIERPKLYDILRTLVPVDKILFSKKVLSIEQNDEGVMIRCSDNTTYHGDVLIGADGAYSTVRQLMYKQMKEVGKLPEEDDTDPPFNMHCLVGVSKPFPPGTFDCPQDQCRYESIFFGDIPYMVICFSGQDGDIKWMVIEDIGGVQTRQDEAFKSNEWGPEGAMAMAEKVRGLATPFGLTMGDVIDNTPKELISKVMLEEKLYTTWNYKRCALMGDACHKFFPYGGQGAINAMLDAVVIANVLQACPSPTIDPRNIERCLDAYRIERFPGARLAHATVSKGAALCKRNTWGSIARFIYPNIPRSLVVAQWDNVHAYQPQASFLPFIEPQGTSKPTPQVDYEFLRGPATTKYV